MILEDLVKFVLNEKVELFSRGLFKRRDLLLKVRIWVYSMAFLHLVAIATKLLTIDFTKAEDPELRIYAEVRWKLITCWFNLISMGYLPMCIYCDWRDLRGEAGSKHVRTLNRLRFILFVSILFPTTAFADILFWRLWNQDRELVAPKSVDTIVPFWTQHCMHTVTLVFTVLDLVLVPRKRPKSVVLELSLLMTFATVYFAVCAVSYRQGVYMYPVLKHMQGFKVVILCLYTVAELLFYFVGQFFINDLIWARNHTKKVQYKSQ